MNYAKDIFLKAKKVLMGGSDENIYAAPFVSAADCHACTTPCVDEDHPHYPSYLKISHDMPMLYSVKPYTRHVLISTGKEDWESHIEDDKESLAHHLTKAIQEGQRGSTFSSGRILVTNSSRLAEDWDGPGWQVVVLPDQIVVNNVTIDQCGDFFQAFLQETPLVAQKQSKEVEQGKGEQHVDSPQEGQINIEMDKSINSPTSRTVSAGKSTFVAHKWQAKAAIMICSHRKRDKRCGVTAPILRKEFMRMLRSKDLLGDAEGDVEIWMISHIG
ncbi:hypothetical protein BGZ94_000367, partial [Podila epigama]